VTISVGRLHSAEIGTLRLSSATLLGRAGMRVSAQFAREYERHRRKGRSLNLHSALAEALRARTDLHCADLSRRLDAAARWRIAEPG